MICLRFEPQTFRFSVFRPYALPPHLIPIDILEIYLEKNKKIRNKFRMRVTIRNLTFFLFVNPFFLYKKILITEKKIFEMKQFNDFLP